MRPVLGLLLMLGGCSAYQVREARQDILGMNAPDLYQRPEPLTVFRHAGPLVFY